MRSPRLLLVNEPPIGLSPLPVSRAITKFGERKCDFGLTVLMAEQNFHQTMRIAGRGSCAFDTYMTKRAAGA